MGRRKISPRLRANRSNARKSTGPRTGAGKHISSMNATIHGLASKTVFKFPSLEVDLFARHLCEKDKSEANLYLAREVVEAQLALNTVRAYKSLLRHLHSAGKDSPLPVSKLLDDPCIKEIFLYMQTNELDFWLGPKTKKDWSFFRRLQKSIYRLSKTPRNPQVQITKLHRYEQAAIQRRQRAIDEWDSYQATKQVLKVSG
jgi:hypothetical protein